MADGDELLEKADALMRRRVFVAGAEPPAESAAPTEEDVPVLTEVVAADEPPAVPAPEALPDAAALRSALAFELESWLDEELPQHVMRVLDGLTDQLIIQISLKARADLLPRLQRVLAAKDSGAEPPAEGD